LNDIIESIQTEARTTAVKVMATIVAIAAQGILIGVLFERFG
jgi:hypothetical protein